MDQASKALIEMTEGPDPYGSSVTDLLPIQIEAASAVLAERREQVPILERRASQAGLKEITGKSDLVPLLFPHTTYKSYPSSFIEKKRWKDLARWLTTLSSADLTTVDFDGVADEDEWVERLRQNGHFVLATSGTTGKCSFLRHSDDDHARKVRTFGRLLGWPFTRADQSRSYFWLGPHVGVSSLTDAATIGSQLWCRPENAFFLTDERLRLTDISDLARMRRRMADGTATPGEISAFERNQKARGGDFQAHIDTFIDRLLDRRHENLVISGTWAQHLMVRDRAQARGIVDGDFNPTTVVSAGGGVKNVPLPTDYKERVQSFYGPVIRTGAYGMTEMFQLMTRCEKMRYHIPPGLLPLVLDRNGDTLLNTEDVTNQIIEGRFAFVDFSITGRWSGTITSDKVSFDTRPECDCGRPGPTILDGISRYQTDDDSIGCAGTIDGYIRGALSS